MKQVKMFTVGLMIAVILGFTSFAATETVTEEKQTADNPIKLDPGVGGGWESGTIVADPGVGGGWEPTITPIPPKDTTVLDESSTA
jgi:hypothetical protein